MPKRNKILVVMPTRQRPWALVEAAASILRTMSPYVYADLLIVVDRDDPLRFEMSGAHVQTVIMEKRIPMLHILNSVIMPRVDDYDVFAFTADDVRYMTKNWDLIVWNILKHNLGIVYGDDGIQHERLPTHPWFSSALVKIVGRVAPACLQHYFFDNYLRELGQEAKILYWRPNLITKHLHHSVGGSPNDVIYAEGEAKFQADKAAFADYLKTGLAADLEKVTAAGAVALPGSHKLRP